MPQVEDHLMLGLVLAGEVLDLGGFHGDVFPVSASL